jgi:uncharacterized protein YndB with AHSA1/START domain
VSDVVVRVTRRFAASAERVFDAWLDPASARRWLFATEYGEMIRNEIDPRVGGRFTFTERRGSEDIEHTGEYLEIDRPRRLVFTFGVPAYSSEFAEIAVEIRPLPAGSCELTLTQAMAPEFAEYRDRTQDGWTKILNGLAKEIDRREP